MEDNKLENSKDIINSSFSSLFNEVDNLISGMKIKSSDEILNGSVAEAQKLLEQILPYQNFYDKLFDAKQVFDEIPNTILESVRPEIEEVEEVNDNAEYTSQINFRIPVLKALIFLGGSSKENEVIDFVKKDMKNKLSERDYEISEGQEHAMWIINLFL